MDNSETVYYELALVSTGQVVAVKVDYPVEIISGIAQREVIKAIEGNK